MRIIAGKHRGRVLSSFKGEEIRPTSDRAKEALFNILQGKISGSRFLDLFCGTGSVGIEALSRGAKEVTLVDLSKESLLLAEKNLNSIGERAETVLSDATSFVKTNKTREYDIIFLDPPYKAGVSELLEEIGKSGILISGGTLIYEHAEKEPLEVIGLRLTDSRRYGIAVFDFYIKV